MPVCGATGQTLTGANTQIEISTAGVVQFNNYTAGDKISVCCSFCLDGPNESKSIPSEPLNL